MMKSAFTVCLLVTLLCGVGARDLLGGNNDDTSCATYNFNGPNIINECPCSGKGKQCHKKFEGQWKMEKFRMDGDQMYCDGHVSGSWGHKNRQKCEDIFVSVPVNLEKCGNKRFRSPGGKCSDWCKPKDGHNSGPHGGEICNVPDFLGCTVNDLFRDNSRRMLLDNGGDKKKHCGHEKCDVISLFLGPVDVDVGCECDIELEQVEIIIGGYDRGVLDELICLIGWLLDTGCDPNWLVDLLNIWLGGCNNYDQCNLLGLQNATKDAITQALGIKA